MVEQTFIIIKPDAIKRGLVGEIISRFERKGLKIISLIFKWRDKSWCEQHYCNLSQQILDKIIPFMLSRRLIGILLEGEDAVRVVREMVGNTNSLDAKPGTIRGDYGGAPVHENLVHAADSEKAAMKEFELFGVNNAT